MTEAQMLAQVLQIKSRTEASQMVAVLERDDGALSSLMSLFFSDDLRICQKASWPMTLLAEVAPHRIYPYLPDMISKLDDADHDALIRNTVRTWQFMEIPEEYEGRIYNICFEYLCDPTYAIAIRVFSMTVCANIALLHPDLASELIGVIEEHIPHGSTGFNNRAAKLLAILRGLTTD